VDGDTDDFIFLGGPLPQGGVRDPGFDPDPELILHRGDSYEFHVITQGITLSVPDVDGISVDGNGGSLANGLANAAGPDGVIIWDVPDNYQGNLDFFDPGNNSRGGTFIVTDPPSDGSSGSTSSTSGTGNTSGPAPIVFELTGNGTDYTFSFGNLPNPVNDPGSAGGPPALVLHRGGIYEFEIMTSSHPFFIAQPGGGADLTPNEGVHNNGADGPTGVVRFEVPSDAPLGFLDFYCGNHSGMNGQFEIKDPPPATSAQRIEAPTRISSITRNSPVRIHFNKPLDAGFNMNDFAPVTQTSIVQSTDLSSTFGPGKFLIFRDLDFVEVVSLFGLTDINAPNYEQNFVDLVNSFDSGNFLNTTNITVTKIDDLTYQLELPDLPLDSQDNFLFFFSPFLTDPGSNAPLQGLIGLNDGALQVPDYTSDLENTDQCKRGIEFDGDLNTIVDVNTGAVKPINASSFYFNCTISQPADSQFPGFSTFLSELASEGVEFDGETIQGTPYFTVEGTYTPGAQIPVDVDGVDIFWKLANGGSFKLGSYDFDATSINQIQTLDPNDLSSTFIAESFLSSPDLTNTAIKIGEDLAQRLVVDPEEGNTGEWTGEYYEQSSEILALIPSVSLDVGGETTTLVNVMLVRKVNYTFPVEATFNSLTLDPTEWDRSEDSPGTYTEELIFMAEGIGEFMVITSELETDGITRSGIVLDAFEGYRDLGQDFTALEQSILGFIQ